MEYLHYRTWSTGGRQWRPRMHWALYYPERTVPQSDPCAVRRLHKCVLETESKDPG